MGERTRVRSFEGPALLWIEDRDISKAAASQGTTPAKIEDSGRASSEEFDNPSKWDLVSTVQVCNRQSEGRFQSRDAESSSFELNLFFVQGMRSVIGGNRVHSSIRQRHQDRFTI